MNHKLKRIICVIIVLATWSTTLCYANSILEQEDLNIFENIEFAEMLTEDQAVNIQSFAQSNDVVFDISGTTVRLSTMYGNADNAENLFSK